MTTTTTLILVFGRENVGPIACPYIVPYLYNRRRHLVQDRRFHSDLDTHSDITITGKEFRGTTGLWELFKRMNVYRREITTADLKKI